MRASRADARSTRARVGWGWGGCDRCARGRGWWPRPASLARDAAVGLLARFVRCRPSPPSKLGAGLPPSDGSLNRPRSPLHLLRAVCCRCLPKLRSVRRCRLRFRLLSSLPGRCKWDELLRLLRVHTGPCTARQSACACVLYSFPSRWVLLLHRQPTSRVRTRCQAGSHGGRQVSVPGERIYDGSIIDLQLVLIHTLIMACKQQQLQLHYSIINPGTSLELSIPMQVEEALPFHPSVLW